MTKYDNTMFVGPGWASLVKLLDQYAELWKIEPVQVKEKFGGLRYYTDSTEETIPSNNEMFLGMTILAEALSFQTCEQCGLPGTQKGQGWIVTMCDECYDKRMKERKALYGEQTGS